MFSQNSVRAMQYNQNQKKMSLILKDPTEVHDIPGSNAVIRAHFEPWTLDEPVTPAERAVATSMSSINEMFLVPTDIPNVGQTVYFLMLWSSPSTILRVFVQNLEDGEMYYYKAIEGSNPPVDLGSYQTSQLSAASICIKGGVNGLNTTFIAGQIVAANLTQVPPNFNTLTTTQIQAWKRVQQTRPISEPIIDGVRFNSPLLTAPEYVSRFKTQSGYNTGYVPSLITEKSSQQQIFTLRENPKMFSSPSAGNNYVIFNMSQELLAQYTIQQGLYRIEMHFCYTADSQPDDFFLNTKMNYVTPTNDFAQTLVLPLPAPNWVQAGTYAWSIDTVTYEAVNNQTGIFVQVNATNYELVSAMVKVTSISSSTDDIMQRVSIAAIQNPPVGQQFIINGLYAYSYVPSINSLNLVKTMLAGLDLQHNIDVAKAILQRIVSEEGYDDVYPEKDYPMILEAINEVAQHSNSSGYAKVNWKHLIGKPAQLGLRLLGMAQPEFSGLTSSIGNAMRNKGFAAVDILPPRDLTKDGDVESNPGPVFEIFSNLLNACCGPREPGHASTIIKPGQAPKRQPPVTTIQNVTPLIAQVETLVTPPAAPVQQKESIPIDQLSDPPQLSPSGSSSEFVPQQMTTVESLSEDSWLITQQLEREVKQEIALQKAGIKDTEQSSESQLTLNAENLAKLELQKPTEQTELERLQAEQISELTLKLSEIKQLNSNWVVPSREQQPKPRIIMITNSGKRIALQEDSVLAQQTNFQHKRGRADSTIQISEPQPDIASQSPSPTSISNINFASQFEDEDSDNEFMPKLKPRRPKHGTRLQQHISKSEPVSIQPGKAATNFTKLRATIRKQQIGPTMAARAVDLTEKMTYSERLTMNKLEYTSRDFVILTGSQIINAALAKLRVSFGPLDADETTFVWKESDYNISFTGFNQAKMVEEFSDPENKRTFMMALLKTIFLHKLNMTTTDTLYIQAEADSAVYGISWMYSFFACIAGYSDKFVFTGGYFYSDGFQAWGEMSAQVIAQKFIGYLVDTLKTRVAKDLVILSINNADEDVWAQVDSLIDKVPAIAQVMKKKVTEFVTFLEYYKYKPENRKILTPANPTDLQWVKGVMSQNQTDEQIVETYELLVTKLLPLEDTSRPIAGAIKSLRKSYALGDDFMLGKTLEGIAPLPYAQDLMPLVNSVLKNRVEIPWVQPADISALAKSSGLRDLIIEAAQNQVFQKDLANSKKWLEGDDDYAFPAKAKAWLAKKAEMLKTYGEKPQVRSKSVKVERTDPTFKTRGATKKATFADPEQEQRQEEDQREEQFFYDFEKEFETEPTPVENTDKMAPKRKQQGPKPTSNKQDVTGLSLDQIIQKSMEIKNNK